MDDSDSKLTDHDTNPDSAQPQLPNPSSPSASDSTALQIPAPPPATTPSTASASPSTRIPEHLMYKNRLQEYTQKTYSQLPVYHTVNEGQPHLPQFRSTVIVNGVQYTSTGTFAQRKGAEQDVARIALECILKKTKDEGLPLIYEDTVFCKSILNEYAVKMQLEKPTYSTVQPQGLLPIFVSSLVFNGVTYTGETGRTKKEAEQLAARSVILSLIGNPVSGMVISEIIQSKAKLYAALHKIKEPHAQSSTIPVAFKDKEAEVVMAGNNEPASAFPQTVGVHPPHHEFVVPKPEPVSKEIQLPITFVHPVSGESLDTGTSLGKKRRRNKKKANKKMRTESQSSINGIPLGQASPYPVA